MAEDTRITWACAGTPRGATFNGWIGCSHAILPGGSEFPECLKCYAERDDKLRKWNGGTWGPGAPRSITSVENWKKPFRWNREAGERGEQMGVFAFSLADVFDVEGPIWPDDRQLPGIGKQRFLRKNNQQVSVRDVFFHEVVAKTPNLRWLILTKRFKECAYYLRHLWGGRQDISQFNDTALPPNPWPNVQIIFSAGTQASLEYAMHWMPEVSAFVKGISAEPLLGPMDFTRVELDKDSPRRSGIRINALTGKFRESGIVDPLMRVNWVITGGESGPGARIMRLEWEASVRKQCADAGVPYFLKQYGQELSRQMKVPGVGADPALWPSEMQVQQFPK